MNTNSIYFGGDPTNYPWVVCRHTDSGGLEMLTCLDDVGNARVNGWMAAKDAYPIARSHGPEWFVANRITGEIYTPLTALEAVRSLVIDWRDKNQDATVVAEKICELLDIAHYEDVG